MSNSIHSESNNNSENSSIVSEQDKYNPEQNSMREPSSDLGRKPLTFIISSSRYFVYIIKNI